MRQLSHFLFKFRAEELASKLRRLDEFEEKARREKAKEVSKKLTLKSSSETCKPSTSKQTAEPGLFENPDQVHKSKKDRKRSQEPRNKMVEVEEKKSKKTTEGRKDSVGVCLKYCICLNSIIFYNNNLLF